MALTYGGEIPLPHSISLRWNYPDQLKGSHMRLSPLRSTPVDGQHLASKTRESNFTMPRAAEGLLLRQLKSDHILFASRFNDFPDAFEAGSEDKAVARLD